MRRILLLTSILLISTAWAVAQYESGAQAAETPGNAFSTTIEGCLDGAAGNYSLTLPSGSIFQLSGNETWLKRHVGEMVRVWGVELPVVRTPGSMSEGTETQPTLQIQALQRLSGACTPISNTIQ
jgi:hypothetical protein